MKRLFFSLTLAACSVAAQSQKNYTSLVNPFIGTGGHGHTFPGATMPFGMMQLSPDTRLEGWDGCGGYHYSDQKIYGFSHTHLSGTGVPDYCDILLMPFTHEVTWNKEENTSPFSHKNEKASPGYYEVLLDKDNILAQLSTSYRSGIHQYTFPAGDGKVLIDLKHRDQVLDSYLEIVSPTEIKGYRKSRSWAQNQLIYFYLKFEQPFSTYILKDSTGATQNGKKKISGKDCMAVFTFSQKEKLRLKVKIGISPTGMEGAKLNLENEIPAWDFERVKTEAGQAWNKELKKIEVKGGTQDEQIIFYTALYHTMVSPTLYNDVNGNYVTTDLKVHPKEDFTNYTVFSLWDTYRALHPLMTIINQERTLDWIKTFLAQYKYGGMLPMWELSGNETFCMIGYHSVPVIVDAYQKGIQNFDKNSALTAMCSYAEGKRFGLKEYAQYGFLSNDIEHESASKTMEYAYDDWCIAQFAKMIGNQEKYTQYIQRAQSYKNLFDPATLHIRGKIKNRWHAPFAPNDLDEFFTEGNSWHYSFSAPQDITGLINLMGGKEKFCSRLNELFTTDQKLIGEEDLDVTGLIGQYAHGNEPSHHLAYLFNYCGMPWRTEEMVHRICKEFYLNTPDGLIGNEDCGQMSAWYVMSALGFYPVCPGDGNYVFGTPVFDEATLRLENGKTFTIKTSNRDKGNFYIQAASLNGQDYSACYIPHTEIMKGGLLTFNLTSTPAKGRGQGSGTPPSHIADNLIVPVPFFESLSDQFKGQMTLEIKAPEKATIMYRLNGEPAFKPYKKPFKISATTTIEAFAEANHKKSRTVAQKFTKTGE